MERKVLGRYGPLNPFFSKKDARLFVAQLRGHIISGPIASHRKYHVLNALLVPDDSGGGEVVALCELVTSVEEEQ